jgi:hypothetical protein
VILPQDWRLAAENWTLTKMTVSELAGHQVEKVEGLDSLKVWRYSWILPDKQAIGLTRAQ